MGLILTNITRVNRIKRVKGVHCVVDLQGEVVQDFRKVLASNQMVPAHMSKGFKNLRQQSLS